MSRRGASTPASSSSSASRRPRSPATRDTRSRAPFPFALWALVGAALAPAIARAFGGKKREKKKTNASAKPTKGRPRAPSSSSSLPRNKASNNKKNKARRAERRDAAEAKRREEERRATMEKEKSTKRGNNVPKVRVHGISRAYYISMTTTRVSSRERSRLATDPRRLSLSLSQDKDMIGGEAGKTFTTTSHVKVSSWAHDIDARRAAGS